VGPFQNCVRQIRPPFKMAAVTRNRSFFNCPLLKHFKENLMQVVVTLKSNNQNIDRRLPFKILKKNICTLLITTVYFIYRILTMYQWNYNILWIIILQIVFTLKLHKYEWIVKIKYHSGRNEKFNRINMIDDITPQDSIFWLFDFKVTTTCMRFSLKCF
jgi:hypothetical protein